MLPTTCYFPGQLMFPRALGSRFFRYPAAYSTCAGDRRAGYISTRLDLSLINYPYTLFFYFIKHFFVYQQPARSV
jgi:hypothetical protein